MRYHRPSAGSGFRGGVGMGIKLGKEGFGCCQSQSKGQRLIPIVAGTKIARPEEAGHGDLRNLFAIAKDPKLCPAAHYLGPTQQADFAA